MGIKTGRQGREADKGREVFFRLLICLNSIQQVYSMLLCVCSEVNHRLLSLRFSFFNDNKYSNRAKKVEHENNTMN